MNAGKLYIGESAGSMVTSPNIEYAKYMDEIEKAPTLKNFDALNLVNFYIVPHNNTPPFEESTQEIIATYSSTLKLKPIDNSEAILIEGNEIKIVKSENS